jgi:hypothetical protein
MYIKATALRAAAPGRARAGRAAWRPVPSRSAGQAGDTDVLAYPTAGLGPALISHTVVVIPRAYFDGFRPPVDPSVLVDATGWLDQPACWPALLYSVGGSPTAAEAFDIDLADLDVMLERMERPGRWPVFCVRLSNGYQMNLLWRNFDDDAGLDYLLTNSDSGQLVRVASLEGCCRGPALSWQELVAVAQLPDPQLTPAERLLMLLPAMTDASMPANAAVIVAEAVTAVGGHRHAEEVANELLTANRHYWGPTEWRDSDGVLVCLGEYSVRRIGGPWADRQLIMAALATG